MTQNDKNKLIAELRRAVADYMRSEGCSCCQNTRDHSKHEATLANLLRVKKYKDGSGYDFSKYQTKRNEQKHT